MKKIIIFKEEIKACKSQAHQLSTNSHSFYRKRNELYNEILHSKTNRKDVRFDLNGSDLMYDEDIPNIHPPLVEEVYKEEGFTKEEYTRLTGETVPNQWYDSLINVDEETGKVYSFEQNGNISVQMGATVHSKKYKHLIKEVWTKCSIEVEII